MRYDDLYLSKIFISWGVANSKLLRRSKLSIILFFMLSVINTSSSVNSQWIWALVQSSQERQEGIKKTIWISF